MSTYEPARHLIDEVHACDPQRVSLATGESVAAELLYADRMEAWVCKLVPQASDLLRLAARCQHLERWSVPRDSYPEGRAGYLTWRRFLYTQQANKAKELLLKAGIAEAEAEAVASWVAKKDLKGSAEAQALEDAAVLVFLESEIDRFVAQHHDYSKEKFIEIIRKSWRKLSPAGQNAAKGLPYSPAVAALVTEAVSAESGC